MFRQDLEAEGVEIVAWRSFADHHAYSPREVASLADAARAAGARLVTTEKDLVRLAAAPLPERPEAPIALRIEIAVHDPEPLDDAVARALDRRAA
jgi:tetraacyldisaccharide 4'-kinase